MALGPPLPVEGVALANSLVDAVIGDLICSQPAWARARPYLL
jgi:hypothetical protein